MDLLQNTNEQILKILLSELVKEYLSQIHHR